MKRHLNTLYVTTQGAYLAKEGEAVVVRVDRAVRLRVPLHTLGGIVCFGHITCTPALMAMCARAGVAISYLTENGRFLARVQGFTPGNVLLRREQYRQADDKYKTAEVARNIVSAKLANSRGVLLRTMRDYPDSRGYAALENAAGRIGWALKQIRSVSDTDGVRGLEGECANIYFGVFNHLITSHQDSFKMNGRSRRPPLDPVNALLSFLYSMLMHDTRAACEAVGLDAAVGFLHRDRPGRPSLALDLMEEFRPFLADRLALSLINRRQVSPDGFETSESGAVTMDDDTRKTVISAFQKRKQDEITHPFLGEKTTVGLMVHLQARLFARYLRGDLDGYPTFIWK